MSAPTTALLLLFGSFACSGADNRASGASDASTRSEPTAAAADVRPGVETLLRDSLDLVRGRRAGLVTNQTGVASDGTPTIDLLWENPDVELVALFSPEHGIRGSAGPGEAVAADEDPRTGLSIHSLYGDTRRPTAEMLEGIEVLVFDIQDIGARYYTYVSTMALAMEAAGDAEIPFVVLDRPNPIRGDRVQGNLLEPAFSSFVGMYPVPMRHGMTPGELARLYMNEFGIEVELAVVPVSGWRRGMTFAETALPWVPPSPNMPSVESALHYPGTCLFEGTNLSVGRGTPRAFQQVGAPWLDGMELARRLEQRTLPDTRFEAVRFTPEDPGDGKFDGVEVSGVRFIATGPAYDPTRAAVAALVEARRLGGESWSWLPSHFDRLAGTDRLREGIEEGLEPGILTDGWTAERARFRERARPHLLYPPVDAF